MELTRVEEIAHDLMQTHMPILVDIGWTFRFDNAKVRFGLCNYRRKIISMSRNIASINDEKHVRLTILHEIAHALVGSGNGHNAKWRAMARKLGHSGSRTYHQSVTVPTKEWMITCPKCKFADTRTRRMRKALACRWCCDTYNGGKFSREYLLVWERNS